MKQAEIDRIQQVWIEQFVRGVPEGKALHVGCGEKPIQGAANIDPNPDRAAWADYAYDVHDLPFEDQTFDVIVSSHVLPALSDIDTAMREMIRVLKIGGVMAHVIPDWRYAPKRLEPRYFWDCQHQGWHGPDEFKAFIDFYVKYPAWALDVVRLEPFPDFNWSFRFVAIRIAGTIVYEVKPYKEGDSTTTTTTLMPTPETRRWLERAADGEFAGMERGEFLRLRGAMVGRRRADLGRTL